MKKIGLVSGSFNNEETNSGDRSNKMKAVVRAITAMLMANNAQGCSATSWTSSTLVNPLRWVNDCMVDFDNIDAHCGDYLPHGQDQEDEL